MKKLSRSAIAVLGALSLMALGPLGTMPCPHPFTSVQARGGHMATTPSSQDFPKDKLTSKTYNGTQINQNFGDTFSLKQTGKCCEYNAGTLTVTYRALQGGCKGSSTSANDAGGLIYHGAGVAGSSGFIPWHWHNSPGCAQYVSTGDVVTVVYTVPANIVASGRVSFSEEDDTAVVSATLRVTGCCVNPTPIRR